MSTILRCIILIAVLLGAAFAVANGQSHASTKPVQLSCTGTMRKTPVQSDYTVALTIDFDEKTVTVGSYSPIPIMSDVNDNTVVFMTNERARPGVSTGTINRLTGAASVHIISLNGLLIFNGICKPAQRLF